MEAAEKNALQLKPADNSVHTVSFQQTTAFILCHSVAHTSPHLKVTLQRLPSRQRVVGSLGINFLLRLQAQPATDVVPVLTQVPSALLIRLSAITVTRQVIRPRSVTWRKPWLILIQRKFRKSPLRMNPPFHFFEFPSNSSQHTIASMV